MAPRPAPSASAASTYTWADSSRTPPRTTRKKKAEDTGEPVHVLDDERSVEPEEAARARQDLGRGHGCLAQKLLETVPGINWTMPKTRRLKPSCLSPARRPGGKSDDVPHLHRHAPGKPRLLKQRLGLGHVALLIRKLLPGERPKLHAWWQHTQALAEPRAGDLQDGLTIDGKSDGLPDLEPARRHLVARQVEHHPARGRRLYRGQGCNPSGDPIAQR